MLGKQLSEGDAYGAWREEKKSGLNWCQKVMGRRRRNGGNGAKEQKREYILRPPIQRRKENWGVAGGDKKGARKREIILLRTPFFPHLFFDLI